MSYPNFLVIYCHLDSSVVTMAFQFPNFYGGFHEDARGFLDNLEMAHLISGRDTNEIKLRAFFLVLKSEART